MSIFSNKPSDMLEIQTQNLDQYNARFATAVRFITDIIDGLRRSNQEIDDQVREIDTYQDRLNDVRTNLINPQAQNAQVLRNFEALLTATDIAD